MTEQNRPLIPAKSTKVLAFHLPQFHPIPENNEWWGPGFTEWNNVTRGRPLFNGHYQPHLPADLGFYDLRLPEVREQQAAMAREAGIDGFIYYHYWFNGRRLLERPVNEILRLKKPDFPFCFCWANEPWSRNWDGRSNQVLMPQNYSDEDDQNHIRWLLEAFADQRYIKVDGRPLMLIYRPSGLPDIRKTAELWRSEAQKRGFPDLYLCSVRAFAEEFTDARDFGLDATVEFKPNGTYLGENLTSNDPAEIGYRLHRVWEYQGMVQHALSQPIPDYPYHAGVCPSWDNSVRRKDRGMIFRESSPEKYQQWLQAVLLRERLRPQRESLVLINAWNEWAEGNHLEPCQRWGRGYLDATKAAITAAGAYHAAITRLEKGMFIPLGRDSRVKYHFDSFARTANELSVAGWAVDETTLDPVDLLVFAQRNAAGEFTLLEALSQQRRHRPDVADHVGSSRALLCGWHGTCRPSHQETRMEDVHLLAINLKDHSATLLSPPR